MYNKFLSVLNTQQQKAILLEDRNSLVLAGAGSGKTKVLTSRIAYICQNKDIDIDNNILAVTFTNKAAKEIEQRVASILDIPTFGMWIGTFHGIAHRLLRKHSHLLGLDNNFQILDHDEQGHIIKKIIKILNLDDKKYPNKLLQNFINKQKDKAIRSNKMINQYDRNYNDIYQAYEEHLLLNNVLDFSDLLLYLYELFNFNQELREYYQKLFKYIFIDEFQDTNKVQYMWLKLLSTDKNYIMAVGDDDQSIYGWRGAVIDNIYNYVKDINNVEVIKLEQNYRSTKNILNAANSVIKNNDNRMLKKLWSSIEDGEKVSVYCALNEFDEVKYIIEQVNNLHSIGVKYSDVGILYRSNYLSRIFEENFIYSSIPYRMNGGFKFFDRAEIKNILAYLKLAISNNDNSAFERIINTPTRGIGNKTLETITNFAKINSISYWDATVNIIQRELVTKRVSRILINFIELINNISNKVNELSLDKLIEYVINNSYLLVFYEEKNTEKDRQRINNLKELISSSKYFDPKIEIIGDKMSILQDFLSFSILESGDISANENIDSVQLMTIHASKGLEFKHVFIVAAEENILLPNLMINTDHLLNNKLSKKMNEMIAEERRLFYVAMTRAMHTLTISYSQVRNIFGRSSFQVKSRFLTEIDEEHLNNIKSNTYNLKNKFRHKSISEVSSFNFLKSNNFNPGDRVYHKIFGNGIFVRSQSQGSKIFFTVNFDNYSSHKVLLSNISNLVKL